YFISYLLHRLLSRSTLSPYTTLFRSPRDQRPDEHRRQPGGDRRARRGHLEPARPGAHARRRPPARGAERGVVAAAVLPPRPVRRDRKSTRLNSSHVKISYAGFCLKKK